MCLVVKNIIVAGAKCVQSRLRAAMQSPKIRTRKRITKIRIVARKTTAIRTIIRTTEMQDQMVTMPTIPATMLMQDQIVIIPIILAITEIPAALMIFGKICGRKKNAEKLIK